MSPIKLRGSGETISDLLRRAGYIITLSCGRGVCGGCVVLAAGKLDLPSRKEKAVLDRKAVSPVNNFAPRLACACRVLGEAEVITQGGAETAASLVSGVVPDYDGFERYALGIAADIGAARLVLELHSLTDKAILARKTGPNPAAAFDRNALENANHSEQSAEPRGVLHAKLWEMMESALLEAKVFADDVRRVVFTGGPVVLELILGGTSGGLSGEYFRADRIFPGLTHADIHAPQGITANAGACAACGLYAADCLNKPGVSLFVDAGTNCKLALIQDKKILCASVDAGPALEGARITRGMPAAAGAVRHVRHTGYGLMCDTIADAPPVGICGSGLISAARLLMELGELDETGYLETDPYELGNSGIHIHGRDIRALQSAKSAVAAGIGALLETAGITADTPDRLILAGGFGNSLDAGEAAAIGLIPKALRDKTVYIGNASLLGAVMSMYSLTARREIAAMPNNAEEISLTDNPVFIQLLRERMAFKSF
ncbi:MAG: ASKHA domain-containing protein [Clostridiales bacterium]|jgi:uncharacterized 2Fe-2S/4Fe-4S cluster protein (DUF4445 family)|nr:ASKHA domain-containing protein [Clostridiales bacterium]